MSKAYNTTEFVDAVDKKVDKNTDPHFNRGDLVDKLAGKREFKDIPKSRISDIVKATVKAQGKLQIVNRNVVKQILGTGFAGIKKTVQNHAAQRIFKFGTFKPSHRKARKGRNPQTGKPLKIAARDTVNFRASSDFKDLLLNK